MTVTDELEKEEREELKIGITQTEKNDKLQSLKLEVTNGKRR